MFCSSCRQTKVLGRDEIDVVVNPTDAPTARFLAHERSEVTTMINSSSLLLRISDTEDDSADLTVEWSRFH